MRKTLLGNSNTPTSPLANSLMAALPSDLRAVMKAVTKYTDNVGNATGHTAGNVTSTSDYLFLLSNYEVQGNDGYANSYEKNSQAQYDYFKAGNSKVAYKHSTTGIPSSTRRDKSAGMAGRFISAFRNIPHRPTGRPTAPPACGRVHLTPPRSGPPGASLWGRTMPILLGPK